MKCNKVIIELIFFILGSHITISYSTFFIKYGNNFYRKIFKPIPETPPGIVSTLKLYLNNSIQEPLNLKNLSTVLNQYYLFRLHEKIDSEKLSVFSPLNFTEPFELDNVTFNRFNFHNVELFGLKALQNNVDLYIEPSMNAINQQMKLNLCCTWDLLLFRGYFDKYFFSYYTTFNTFRGNLIEIRTSHSDTERLLDDQYYRFLNEKLVHTYDSSHEDYSVINNTLYSDLINVIELHWLPKLSEIIFSALRPVTLQKNIMFSKIYRELILNSTLDVIKSYPNKNSTIKVNSFVWTAHAGPRTFQQIYNHIKVTGLLNFRTFRLSNSSVKLENQTLKMSDTVTLFYENENPFVSFKIIEGKREIQRRYSVNSLSITAVYSCKFNETPFQVFRDKDAFINGSGFLIKFNLKDYDPVYEFLFRHIGNHIARSIDEFI